MFWSWDPKHCFYNMAVQRDVNNHCFKQYCSCCILLLCQTFQIYFHFTGSFASNYICNTCLPASTISFTTVNRVLQCLTNLNDRASATSSRKFLILACFKSCQFTFKCFKPFQHEKCNFLIFLSQCTQNYVWMAVFTWTRIVSDPLFNPNQQVHDFFHS